MLQTCQAHEEMIRTINSVNTSAAVLVNEVKELKDRIDRHGKAVNELASAFNGKIDDHHKILYGDRNTKGIMSVVQDYENASKKGSDWKDWAFRLVITTLVGWCVANTSHIISYINTIKATSIH